MVEQDGQVSDLLPYIVVVDDTLDLEPLHADIEGRYGSAYRVLAGSSPTGSCSSCRRWRATATASPSCSLGNGWTR